MTSSLLFSKIIAFAGTLAARLLRAPHLIKARLLRALNGESPLRVALGTFGYTPMAGGVGNYLISMIRGWAEECPSQPLHLFATKGAFDYLNKNLPLHARLNFTCLHGSEELSRHQREFDVFCLLGHLEPIPPPARSVYYLADLQERFFPEFFSEKEHARRTENHAHGVQYASRIITGAEFCRRSYVELLGMPAERIAVAHLPVADLPSHGSRPDNMPSSVRDFIYFPADDYLHKNHKRLLAALGRCSENGMSPTLICTGGRFSDRSLEAIAAEAGMEGRFFHLGKVTRENVAWLYRHSRFLAFPTLFEGFGLPVLEGFSARTPVLCSGLTSLPELGGDAVMYCNPFDVEDLASRLERLWNDEALRKELISRGSKKLEKFALKRVIERHREIFVDVRDEPLFEPLKSRPQLPDIDVDKAWRVYRETAVAEIRDGIPVRREDWNAR